MNVLVLPPIKSRDLLILALAAFLFGTAALIPRTPQAQD